MIRINAPESQRTLRNHKERSGITTAGGKRAFLLLLYIYAPRSPHKLSISQPHPPVGSIILQ